MYLVFLNKILNLSLIDKKNMVRRKESTEGGQSGSSTEIPH